MALLNFNGTCGETRELFLMRGREILVDSDNQPVQILPEEQFIKDAIYDTIDGFAAAELSKEFVPISGYKFLPLRDFFYENCSAEDSLDYKCNRAWAAARMRGYLNWRAAVRFCPYCGAPLENHPVENARACPKCGKVQYPRIEPCVIAVICKGDEILLLRHVQRNQDIWCCLAGFVEAGESLEQALVREVREETGLEIENIRYAGSQSWPFPDQLMVGFYADYKEGEITLQEDEIAAAKWFKKDDLPAHPAPGSISWNLIHFKPITKR